MARHCNALPTTIQQSSLIVVMAEPQNLQFLDELRFKSGWPARAARFLSRRPRDGVHLLQRPTAQHRRNARDGSTDRKSTRLNSSHSQISYAVFCLKKKKTK